MKYARLLLVALLVGTFAACDATNITAASDDGDRCSPTMGNGVGCG